MEVQAIYKHARMSPRKVGEVTRQIQGKSATEALELLRAIPRKSARLVEKTLKSAIANATNNAKLNASVLRVRLAVANEGARMKRWQPKARGSAGPILKRMSHIRIVLTDE
ncbi:MAG: 50S ribosomal protein L22 [Verrucomicrobiae bacterium]|nr:50S ribosomal protein L22 [Verrucomicrobiae bacterium]MDW8344567.1 50S ribosomal protein L22 [Verrucomicrobiae bacterium]